MSIPSDQPPRRLIPSRKYRGIYWNTEEDHWEVQVTLPESIAECGTFLSEEEAARAYDKCVVDLLPGTPELNFPEE